MPTIADPNHTSKASAISRGLSDLLKVDPDEHSEEGPREPVRIRPEHAGEDDSHDLIGFPREWAEKDKRFKWA